jgi:hypothetical protein
MSERKTGGRIIMTINYWHLKNKDPGMEKFGKERAKIIVNELGKFIVKYCKGSYEDLYGKDDQPLYYKSDQRIDFIINVYQEIMKLVSSKLSEAEKERNRRGGFKIG